MQVKNYDKSWKVLLTTLLLSLTVLSGCAGIRPEPEVVVKTEYVDRKIPVKDRPKAVNLHEINFYAVTRENLDEFLQRFEADNGNVVFFAISVPDYEDIAMNMAELRRYIEQQKAIIMYYERAVTKETPKPLTFDN